MPRTPASATIATVALDLGGSIGATALGATEAPAVDHLLELLDRPPWQRDALCREYAGRVNFFPGRGEPIADAKAVCQRCLVRSECMLYALEHDEPYGRVGRTQCPETSRPRARRTRKLARRPPADGRLCTR